MNKFLYLSNFLVSLLEKEINFPNQSGRHSVQETHLQGYEAISSQIQKKNYIRVRDAADFLGVSSNTLRNWEKSGYLVPKRSKGGDRRYHLKDLEMVLMEKNPALASLLKERIQQSSSEPLPFSQDTSSPKPVLNPDFGQVPRKWSLLSPSNLQSVRFRLGVFAFSASVVGGILAMGAVSFPTQTREFVSLISPASVSRPAPGRSSLVSRGLVKSEEATEAWETPDQEKSLAGDVLAASDTSSAFSLEINAPTNVNGSLSVNGKEVLTGGNVNSAYFLRYFNISDGKTLTASDSTSFSTNSITFGGGEVLTLTASNALTLTTTGSTTVTLPTTGTLATLTGTESLSSKTLVSPIITTSPTAAGATWADLGSVTKVDINGGSLDGIAIGAASPSTGAFTTFSAGTGTFTVSSTGALSAATGITSSGTITFSGLTASRPVITTTGGALTTEAQLSTTRGGLGADSSAAGAGELLYSSSTSAYGHLAAGTATYVLVANGAAAPVWTAQSGLTGVGTAFSSITSGTNTGAAMFVGTGASLAYTGNGVVDASLLLGATWVSPGTIGSTSATTGKFTTLNATTALQIDGTQIIDSSRVFTNIGTINTNTFTSTALTFGGTSPVITGTTTLNLNTTSGTGSILFGGGSGSTGCTLDDNTGDLTCVGSITGGSTGSQGYWGRSVTTLSPVTSGDSVTTSGNISSTGTGAITSGGTLTASNGLTLTTGALSLTATSGSVAATLTSSATAFNINSGLFNIDTTNSFVGVGTTSPGSKLGVAGGLGVGISYSVLAAPTNGLIVQGNIGVGTTTTGSTFNVNGNSVIGFGLGSVTAPTNGLAVSGSVGVGVSSSSNTLAIAGSVGIGYSYARAAGPTNGLAVEGDVGIGTTSPGSKLGVAGGLGVGISYAIAVAPTNGLAVQGSVGIGVSSPSNTLAISGSVGIGYSYARAAGPTNGLAVEGSVGIGTTSPGTTLDVTGTGRFSSTLTVTAGGATITAGNLGVNSAICASQILCIGNGTGSVATAAVTEYGLVSQPLFTSTATTDGIAGYFRGFSTAASYTMTTATGVWVENFSKGANSVVTTNRGLYVAAQIAGGTNNYGIYVESPSGGSSINAALAIANGGNIELGGAALRATTNPTNALSLYNGTAPVGTLTNGVSFYSSGGEAYVMDASGNATLLSTPPVTGQAVGVTSAPTTTSATYVDLTDMSVTVTTSGGDLVAMLSATLINGTAANNTALALSLDGATEVADQWSQKGLASSRTPFSIQYRWTSVAAGSHTIKGRWKSPNESTIQADTTLRTLTVFEVK